MIFVILFLFSPLAVNSFPSVCPQQPNNVIINCNNGQPIGFFPGFPPARGTARLMDTRNRKPPARSKLELAIDRSRSSEESDESGESSEELQGYFVPSPFISHRPSIHTSTTVDNRLDFINSLRRLTPGLPVNNLRSVSRNPVPSHTGRVTLGQITTGEGISNIMGTIPIDETHGHGHSGQYNHGVEHPDTTNHGHGHGPEHGHEHEHGHGHEHRPGHSQSDEYVLNHGISSHVPTHMVIPTNNIYNPSTYTISGAHIIPERVELPTGHIITSGTSGSLVDSQGFILMDLPINGQNTMFQVTGIQPGRPALGHDTTGQYNPTLDLLYDTHDRLILTTRGFKALGTPFTSRGTYELYPQDFLNRVVTVITVPSVIQNGLATGTNCAHIPTVSEIAQPEDAKTTLSQTPSPDLKPPVFTVSHSENVPSRDVSSTPSGLDNSEISMAPSTEHTDEIIIPLNQPSSMQVTTADAVERPTNIEINIPTSETIVHEMPGQTGSTVTKVTTNTVEKLPITSDVSIPTIETIVHETPVQPESTVTTVTATVEERPVQAESTVTKVTTTVEERPVTSNMENVFEETPEAIDETQPVVTDAGKVTDILASSVGEIVDTMKVVGESANVDTAPLLKLARPIRDGRYRYDSYRQRTQPIVYGF